MASACAQTSREPARTRERNRKVKNKSGSLLAVRARLPRKSASDAASGGFSLAWLLILAFTKSFAWLVSRVVGLFYTPQQTNQLRDRQATRTTQ